MFYGKTLQQLRELNGLSRKELAKILTVSEQTIGQYENNIVTPRIDILHKLQDIFNVKINYFMQESFIKTMAIHEERIAYRTKDKESRKKTKLELTYITFINYFIDYFLSFIEIDNSRFYKLKNIISSRYEKFSSYNEKEIEYIANFSREFLNLHNNSDLMYVLENSGIYILEKNLGNSIDAYSGYSVDEKPYIVLGNIKKSAVRRNFDLAHELGHLILHGNIEMDILTNKQTKELEKQANFFASVFLLPKEEFIFDFKQIKKKTNPDFYLNLKKKYLVSITALEYRAYKLKLLTDQQNRYFWTQIKKKNYKINEPLDNELIPRKPERIKSILEYLLDTNIINIYDLTDTFHVNLNFWIRLFDLKQDFFSKYIDKEIKSGTIINISKYIMY